MAEIKVEKPTQEQLKQMGVESWPIWEKEISRFNWHYDEKETCYLLEGEVTVTAKDGKKISFGKGELVTFPQDLSCTWDIKKAVRKHYNFG